MVVGTAGQVETLDLERGDLLPGMADQLLGARIGAPLEVTVTLPEEYARPELRGEMVVISVEVKQVQAKRLPPLDDNLAAIAGHGETLAELRQYVREQLIEEGRLEAERAQEAKALDQLRELSRVEVPEVMIEAEIDRQIRDLELRLSGSGVSLEQLLASDGKPLEQLRGERRQPAIERVQLELILEELARREGLHVSDKELDENLRRIFASGTAKDVRRRAREPLRRELLLGKARRRVAALARGETGKGRPRGNLRGPGYTRSGRRLRPIPVISATRRRPWPSFRWSSRPPTGVSGPSTSTRGSERPRHLHRAPPSTTRWPIW